MILVLLGTQDMPFKRLLDVVQKQVDENVITTKVVVQAGTTHYESLNMDIYDFVSRSEFEKLIDESAVVITHGGVGSIIPALKKGKLVIVAARLKEYGEHANDHQVQIRDVLDEQGYITALRDFNDLGDILKNIGNVPKREFISNNEKMIDIISIFIKSNC